RGKMSGRIDSSLCRGRINSSIHQCTNSLENYLSRVLRANNLTIFAPVLVSLHLHLIGAFGLLRKRVRLLLIGLERRETRVLAEDQHVPRSAVVHRPKNLVGLLKSRLDLGV